MKTTDYEVLTARAAVPSSVKAVTRETLLRHVVWTGYGRLSETRKILRDAKAEGTLGQAIGKHSRYLYRSIPLGWLTDGMFAVRIPDRKRAEWAERYQRLIDGHNVLRVPLPAEGRAPQVDDIIPHRSSWAPDSEGVKSSQVADQLVDCRYPTPEVAILHPFDGDPLPFNPRLLRTLAVWHPTARLILAKHPRLCMGVGDDDEVVFLLMPLEV